LSAPEFCGIKRCALSEDISDRLGNKLWLITLNVMAARLCLSQLSMFRSVSQIFLQDMKYYLRLFSHWVGSRWQRHLSMLNHHERFVKMPGQRLIFQ